MIWNSLDFNWIKLTKDHAGGTFQDFIAVDFSRNHFRAKEHCVNFLGGMGTHWGPVLLFPWSSVRFAMLVNSVPKRPWTLKPCSFGWTDENIAANFDGINNLNVIINTTNASLSVIIMLLRILGTGDGCHGLQFMAVSLELHVLPNMSGVSTILPRIFIVYYYYSAYGI